MVPAVLVSVAFQNLDTAMSFRSCFADDHLVAEFIAKDLADISHWTSYYLPHSLFWSAYVRMPVMPADISN